jgi:hypothetical protein
MARVSASKSWIARGSAGTIATSPGREQIET